MPKDDKTKKSHVVITINGAEYEVHKGNHPVVELKNKGNVPHDHVLCIIKPGEPPIPLKDEDHIDIRGGEIFASHQPTGAAS